MTKRIMWKKGMRLTDEILALSDKCTEDLVLKGLVLGACGRFGLMPSTRRFDMSIDINNDVIDVVSIDCIGLARDGSLIDVQYDTNYTNTFDTRVIIPSQNKAQKYYLCISSNGGVRDTNDGMCEPQYCFILIEETSPVPNSALPIARIFFDDYCWRSDEINFLPPCLYVKSHFKYEELAQQFTRFLREINYILPEQFSTENKDALKIFWPMLQQIIISMDKELDTMTPMAFLGNIQKLVSSFYCACSLDDYITISEPAQYLSFINISCNYQNVFETIQNGVSLSYVINEKVKNFIAEPHTADSILPSPTIEKGQLRQMVKFGSAIIKVTNNAPGSTIFYTLDGSIPTQASKSGDIITIDSGFTDDWHKEPPRNITIKIVAYKDGIASEVETFSAQIKKGNPFNGKQI